jgi:pyruvyl transferase EpsO
MKTPLAAPPRLLATLRATFSEVIGNAPDCALVDFPDHANVGDSAIWLGQAALLRELNTKIRYCATYAEHSAARLRQALRPGSPVLICGGGNFGTLWPRHQQLRESMLAELKDYRVVQLPQSIHYDDDATVEATAQAIAGHPDFTLMVRDQASLRVGTEQLRARTALCPDAALALAGTLARPAPRVDCFVLARTDKERSAVDLADEMRRAGHGMSMLVGDWLEEPRSSLLRVSRWLRVQGHAGRLPMAPALLGAVYTGLAQERVERGLRQLAQGRVVVTDRLHGMILSAAAGIPCVALDNSYGKVSGFHRQWMQDWPRCETAATVPEAIERARRMLADG